MTAGGQQKMDITDWRGQLGQYGISGKRQTLPMLTMSPGFRARVVFCLMSLRNPHLLLLDEPTNPLDMDMIDSLALAIKNFNGGLVLVSHDFRLLEQVRLPLKFSLFRALLPGPPRVHPLLTASYLVARAGCRLDLGVRQQDD